MKNGLRRLAGLALCLFMAGSLAHAQGSGSSSLSGLVVDSGGGIIPGATVVVKNNATSVAQTVITNSSGAWSLPGLPTGVYTVTVSLSGFKTVVINDVRLLAGTANEVKATLEIGQLTESIVVQAGTELVQTQSATVQSSLKVEQLQELVRCQLDLLVVPLGRPVVARDEPRTVDAPEVAEHECVPALRLVTSALGEPEVPRRVGVPRV